MSFPIYFKKGNCTCIFNFPFHCSSFKVSVLWVSISGAYDYSYSVWHTLK